ncbi:hypothetical protein [Clostridium sp. AWRP]|uniref:hypothetical protein n=1 Tax=Clostridium sp. AWRP TaxID=2212991 RepID=UPI000FDAC146|nr:hypothetical protein [Clostridium sp. AWRP]AZV58363.1 hypothetical protein DMR38_18205 [Clostridium sp. AWRP]
MDGWGEKFYEYCHNNKQQINVLDNKFFFNIDIETMLKKIEKSSVKDLYGLLSGIEEIYSFSNLNDVFKADINNLEKIISKLDIDQLSDGKITKRFALEKIKDKLDKLLRSIKH